MVINKCSITIFNSYLSLGLPPFGGETKWVRTVIHGCQWDDQVDRNPNNDGRSTVSQTVSVIIPKNAKIPSGRKFIDRASYNKLTNDNDQYWTLGVQTSPMDYIVYGEVEKEITSFYTISNLISEHKFMRIQGITDMMSSPILPHIEVGGV